MQGLVERAISHIKHSRRMWIFCQAHPAAFLNYDLLQLTVFAFIQNTFHTEYQCA